MTPDQTSLHPTLPDPPPGSRLREIGIRDDELRVVSPSETWWRVHRTEGDFVLAWNEFRHYGPVLRFDPHPEPAREHADCAVWYGAGTLDAALAEAFQGDRTIDRVRDRPYLTGLAFTRTLCLLDLAVDSSGAWATRAGGTFAISTAPHAITQRWARAIVQAFPDLDGVRYNSRFTGHPCAGNGWYSAGPYGCGGARHAETIGTQTTARCMMKVPARLDDWVT